ncbi:uncharacterized protein LOC134851837 [Symsagittifera roscoffensis]|uniref:uncharacterized protein LOC134851837 n=1 Tax=Symsagittifera roscoffensis TaxID=84072 RepID=UPI00307C94BF
MDQSRVIDVKNNENSINGTMDQSFEVSTTSGPTVFERNPLILVAVLGGLGCASQLIAILISRGLVGDFSARTFLWVQAVGQMLQQLVVIQFSLCGAFGGVFCLQRISRTSCKTLIFLGGSFFLLADYLAVPVALDRINAVRYPVWYKQSCTQKAAWLVVGPVCLVIFILAIPKSMGSDLVGGDCVTLHEQYDQFLSLMGVPAVACVVACTVLLLVLIRQKSQSSVNSSHDAQSQRPITLALTVTSTVFAIFGILQYLLMFLTFLLRDPHNRAQGVLFLGIGQLLGSTGIIIRGPVMLLMKPMRKAFARGLRI